MVCNIVYIYGWYIGGIILERLEQQIKFILEVDKLKTIFRQSYIGDATRKENDSEHSWHLALMCILLKEYANESIDVLKVMTMVLIHDIVEIDAGDTYAYDTAANTTKIEREVNAANRLFNILPSDQAIYIRELWDEFEEGKTSEAKFAVTLDKIQPLLLNDYTKGIAWRQHDVKLEQVLKRNENTSEGSIALWDYCKRIIDKNVKNGNIIN